MGTVFHIFVLVVLVAVGKARQVDVVREETDYHIGRGLSNFASDSPGGCKDDGCRSPQHLFDRDTDYPSHHLRDQQDLDKDEAHVHEERDIDAFLEDRGPTHLRQHESLFRSHDPENRRVDTSYRSEEERDPTVTYYAEPPRHVYDDRSSRRNRSDHSTSWNPFRRSTGEDPTLQSQNRHSHEERDYRIRDPSRSTSRLRSSPYRSRDSRYPYEEEEQRTRLGLYPEGSSRRRDTRDSERFVDKYFRNSRCPQLRQLSRESGRTLAPELFDAQRLDTSNGFYIPSSHRGLSMEDPSRIVVVRVDSNDMKSVKKHLKGKLGQFQRRSEGLDLEGVDFLQLLNMMDEEEERLNQPNSRLSLTSRLPRRLQLETQDQDDLDTLARIVRSRDADRCRSSFLRPSKLFKNELQEEEQEDDEPSCAKSSKSKSQCTRCDDEADPEVIKNKKTGKKASSKGHTKSNTKSNSKGSSKGSKSKKQK